MTDSSTIRIANISIGNQQPLFLIAGPCVIESEQLIMHTAETLKKISQRLNIGLIFKSSFDKANRTSANAFRGLGIEQGLSILNRVKEQFNLPILTDVHEDSPLNEVANVVDVLQTPAFLVRQTNFIQRVCEQGKPVNIKKGQFQAPWDMLPVIDKARATGNQQLMVCERGASFGYNTLVSDMRSLVTMRQTQAPVIFDATHSVQQPGGMGHQSGGQRQMVPHLAKAAVAVGVAGIFMETHPNPDKALCDGPNMWPLNGMEALLLKLQQLDQVSKASPQFD